MNTIYLATLIFGFICIIATTVYLYTLIRRITKTFDSRISKKWLRKAIPLIIAALIIGLIIIYNPFILCVIYFIMASILVDIIHLIIIKFANKSCKPIKIWTILHTAFIIPILFSIGMMVYGHINIMNVQATYYTVTTEKNIRKEGYKVCLLADLHFGSSIDIKELEKVCDEISSQNIDILILCGDLVDEGTSYEQMSKAFKILGEIDTTSGAYFVYGNHDCQTYVPSPSFTKEQLSTTIEKNNITILEDELVTINNELTIIGRVDASFSTNSRRQSIDELFTSVDYNDYIMVLDHQPKEYAQNSNAGTDLLLSGHTHAGQFWPLNLVMEVIPFNDGVYGLEKINNMDTIITSGISGWAFPFKTSAPAEYVIVNIKP